MKQARIKIGGKAHVLVVLKVEARDHHGRPCRAAIGHDDSEFHIQGGEEFITAWVPEETMKKHITA